MRGAAGDCQTHVSSRRRRDRVARARARNPGEPRAAFPSRLPRDARRHATIRARRGSLLPGRGPASSRGPHRRRRAALTDDFYGGANRAECGEAGGVAQVRPAPGPGPNTEARARRSARPPASSRLWSRRGSSNSSCGGTSRLARAPAITWATGIIWTIRWRPRRTPACAARSPRRTPTYVPPIPSALAASPHDPHCHRRTTAWPDRGLLHADLLFLFVQSLHLFL